MSYSTVTTRKLSYRTHSFGAERNGPRSNSTVSTQPGKISRHDSYPHSQVRRNNFQTPIGYVAGMPAPDWFNSGASRDERERRKWSLPELLNGTVSRESGVFDGFAGASSRATYSSHGHRQDAVEEEEEEDDEEVWPDESVSQVGLSRAGGRRRVHVGVAGSSVGFCGSEVSYFDEANGHRTRNVRPNWAR